MNPKNKIKIGLLSLGLITLVGCQTTTTTENEPQYYTLPEVEYKYDNATIVDFNNRIALNDTNRYEGLVIDDTPILQEPEELPDFLFYDTGVDIPYPEDGVKGIYLTGANVANTEYFDYIIDYINRTDLNAVVIDFKDDWGNILHPIESDNSLIQGNTIGTIDFRQVLEKLEANQIYPIARIVTFKDSMLPYDRLDLSFVDPDTGELWTAADGAAFLNPFLRENWDYTLEIAEEAAKLGFKDIQFDYIRFAEGFETFGYNLDYDIGEYADFVSDDPELEGIERVAAINDFLVYAQNWMKPYNVDISADVFGYTAIAGNSPDVRGIGQNFAAMSEIVDVVSSMIYPSHWSPGFFGYDYPDLYPFEFTNTYIQEELYVLDSVENEVVTRPWIQDFTLNMYGEGTYSIYGPAEVEAQIQALKNNGVNEYLIWNAGGEYTEGVNYNPPAYAPAE